MAQCLRGASRPIVPDCQRCRCPCGYTYTSQTSVAYTLITFVRWLLGCGLVGGFDCVIQRKRQTPGTPEEHKRQEKPTINAIDRQPTNLTDQVPSTIERAAREMHNTN